MGVIRRAIRELHFFGKRGAYRGKSHLEYASKRWQFENRTLKAKGTGGGGCGLKILQETGKENEIAKEEWYVMI